MRPGIHQVHETAEMTGLQTPDPQYRRDGATKQPKRMFLIETHRKARGQAGEPRDAVIITTVHQEEKKLRSSAQSDHSERLNQPGADSQVQLSFFYSCVRGNGGSDRVLFELLSCPVVGRNWTVNPNQRAGHRRDHAFLVHGTASGILSHQCTFCQRKTSSTTPTLSGICTADQSAVGNCK